MTAFKNTLLFAAALAASAALAGSASAGCVPGGNCSVGQTGGISVGTVAPTLVIQSADVKAAHAAPPPPMPFWLQAMRAKLMSVYRGLPSTDFCVLDVEQSDHSKKCVAYRSGGVAVFAQLQAAWNATPFGGCVIGTNDDITGATICAKTKTEN